MEKNYNNRNFEKELNRFLRAVMSAEEEDNFLAFLRDNKQFASRAFLSTMMIKEIRLRATEVDAGILEKFRN